MAGKSPVFPIPEPHHFSDYGFDPQFDYFQVLEEAKKRQQKRSEAYCFRSIDTLHLKLHNKNKKTMKMNKNTKKRRGWWKNALLFFKSRWAQPPSSSYSISISGPIYITDPFTGPTTLRPSSGSHGIPYVNLRELNMDHPHRISSASPMPIYLVS